MTTVEILLSYTTPPSGNTVLALATTKDVYGIRHLAFDRTARTLRIEYDATRLSAADVIKLVRQCGLEVSIQPPQAAAPPGSLPAAATA